MAKCEFCGDDEIDCECHVDHEWYDFEDLKPSPGQKCRVGLQMVVDAIYIPDDNAPVDWKVISEYKVTKIEVWRPLYGKNEEINADA